ncbi:MAG: hypothetical protein ABEH47_03530 [Haloferacaceae archaeon]
MTRYECDECGYLTRFERVERNAFVTTCPACEETARFEVAFTGEGVSF